MYSFNMPKLVNGTFSMYGLLAQRITLTRYLKTTNQVAFFWEKWVAEPIVIELMSKTFKLYLPSTYLYNPNSAVNHFQCTHFREEIFVERKIRKNDP